MLLREILSQYPIGLSVRGVNPQTVYDMVASSADWLARYTRPGTPPLQAVEEWLERQPWNAMKELWRTLPEHAKAALARYIVSTNRMTAVQPTT